MKPKEASAAGEVSEAVKPSEVGKPNQGPQSQLVKLARPSVSVGLKRPGSHRQFVFKKQMSKMSPRQR